MKKKPSEVALVAGMLANSLESIERDLERAVSTDGLGDEWTPGYAEHIRGRLENVETLLADLRRDVAIAAVGAVAPESRDEKLAYFVEGGAERQRAELLLEGLEIPFEVERWERGIWKFTVPADREKDLGKVFV